MSYLPSQYAEEIETFRHILNLPDPRDTMPRSSTTILGLDDEKGQQELRPRGPSAMLPLSPYLKDAFASTTKWYKVGQPCFKDKMQELNSDFAKICISPKPYGASMEKVPLQVLKELEHQARHNLCTFNFLATLAKTASVCSSTMEKCQNSLKSTFKKVEKQIQNGANPGKSSQAWL